MFSPSRRGIKTAAVEQPRLVASVDARIGASAVQRCARSGLADRLGFDYVWATEHHFREEYAHSSAPEIFLAACSQRTKNIRLGHGIALQRIDSRNQAPSGSFSGGPPMRLPNSVHTSRPWRIHGITFCGFTKLCAKMPESTSLVCCYTL